MNSFIRVPSQAHALLDKAKAREGEFAEGVRATLMWLTDQTAATPFEEGPQTPIAAPSAAEEAAALAEPQSDEKSAERQGDFMDLVDEAPEAPDEEENDSDEEEDSELDGDHDLL